MRASCGNSLPSGKHSSKEGIRGRNRIDNGRRVYICICVEADISSRDENRPRPTERVPKRDCSQRFDSVYDSSNNIIVIIVRLEIMVK